MKKSVRGFSDFNYTGPSMKPLLRPEDGLLVDRSFSFESLCRGDVICHRAPNKPIHIIHRIVAVTSQGLITRGDNNPTNDPYFVTKELDPIRLTHVRRGKRTIRIRGGGMGLLMQRKNIMRSFFLRYVVSRLINFLDRTLVPWVRQGFLCRFHPLNPGLSIRRFKNGEKELKLLFYGKRKIGHLKTNGKWHVSFPWRYFVDRQKLYDLIN